MYLKLSYFNCCNTFYNDIRLDLSFFPKISYIYIYVNDINQDHREREREREGGRFAGIGF